MRKTFTTIALFAVLGTLAVSYPLTAHAQHFDWVKSYWGIATNSGQADGNKIIGTDADSDGNVYVIGEFTLGAQINGVDLLPMTPYGPSNRTVNVVIAKLSPTGELLWHKAIHSNNGLHTRPIGIKCVGDTSIACMADVDLPGGNHYAYFLDTLLPNWESGSFLMDIDSIMSGSMTAWLLFSPDGDLQERELLSMSYIDINGNDIMGDRNSPNGSQYAKMYYNQAMAVQAFTVDNDGNIIMTRGAWDHLFLYCDTCDYHQQECSPENGLITGFNILVGDTGGLRKLRCSIPEPTSLKNYQLLKFSPHFDSLIATAYYFEMSPDDTVVSHISLSDLHSVKTDSRNRVYVTGSIVNDASYRNAFNLAIPNSDNLILDVQEANNTTGFLIQYDSRLVAQRIAQLKGVNNNSQFTMNSTFHCINFDEDSNVVILIDVGKTTDDMNDDRYFLYDTTRLDIGLTTCFLRIDTVWNYLSSGQINSPSSISRLNKRVKQYDIAVQNNRIMAQVRYWNSLATIDSTFITSGRSHGLITWDYDGHCISFIDYHSPSLNTEMGGTILRDSILYLSGTFQDGATLQDFSVPSNGYCNAYIAKFVDTAFMTPYVYDTTNHGGGGEVRITVVDPSQRAPLVLVSYPNPFRQRVTIESSETLTATAWLTDLTGRREQVRLTAEGNGRYTLDLTSRPQATYLLTLTTASGKTQTIRLMKMSDIFTR